MEIVIIFTIRSIPFIYVGGHLQAIECAGAARSPFLAYFLFPTHGKASFRSFRPTAMYHCCTDPRQCITFRSFRPTAMLYHHRTDPRKASLFARSTHCDVSPLHRPTAKHHVPLDRPTAMYHCCSDRRFLITSCRHLRRFAQPWTA